MRLTTVEQWDRDRRARKKPHGILRLDPIRSPSRLHFVLFSSYKTQGTGSWLKDTAVDGEHALLGEHRNPSSQVREASKIDRQDPERNPKRRPVKMTVKMKCREKSEILSGVYIRQKKLNGQIPWMRQSLLTTFFRWFVGFPAIRTFTSILHCAPSDRMCISFRFLCERKDQVRCVVEKDCINWDVHRSWQTFISYTSVHLHISFQWKLLCPFFKRRKRDNKKKRTMSIIQGYFYSQTFSTTSRLFRW